MGRADVSIVTPQPIDRGDRCAEHCIHAIVWQKVDGKAPILIDRIVDGVPQDRSSWMVNSRTVLDIFVHVGWDRYVDDPDYNCVLDDDGVWLTPDVPVEVFDGFYGSLRVSKSFQGDETVIRKHETLSWPTTFQSGESENCEDDWQFDVTTSMHFWTGLEVDWTSYEHFSNDEWKVSTSKEGKFYVDNRRNDSNRCFDNCDAVATSPTFIKSAKCNGCSQPVSLLQTQVNLVPHWILQYSMPTIIDKHHDHDDFVRRSRIVNRFPERFEEPTSWYEVLMTHDPPATVEMLTPMIKRLIRLILSLHLDMLSRPWF